MQLRFLTRDKSSPGTPAVKQASFSSGSTVSDEVHLGWLFDAVAARRPDEPAVTTPSSEWTYARLRTAARAIAAQVASYGNFAFGDRVILLLPNGLEYVAAFFGVLLAGGVVVPLSPQTERSALLKIWQATDTAFVISTAEGRRLQPELREMPFHDFELSENDSPADQFAASPDLREADEVAAIFFTAGSTGSSKGVMLSHANLISNARAIQEYLKISDAERPLCVLPFHHAFGNSVLQSHLLAGAHLVLGGQAMFPETILQALRKYECTSFSAVPDLYRMLIEHSSLGESKLPALRYMAVAGGALRGDRALEIARRIAPAQFYVMYGQTEATARLAYVPPERLREAPAGSIGRSIPGVVLEVVNDGGTSVLPGETGELRAKGPNVMLGYWRDPAATSAQVREGWLYTGDLATRDSQGWLVHKGRRNSLVKIAGFRVHPSELEEFALRKLAVSEAVVVAFEKQNVGTRLALFVRDSTPGKTLTTPAILARCCAELPRHLVPEFVQIIDNFPLNEALKIDRLLLLRLAEQEAGCCRSLG